jgi:signal transduction histidine kinase
VGLRATTEAVTVTVQDTGVGISPEHLPRVFDPFFTTEADSGRAGLGLSVSYGIVAAHQGRLDVASQEGRGSIFSLWLPREQPDDAARPGTAAP